MVKGSENPSQRVKVREINYPDVVGWEWTGKDWVNSEGETQAGFQHQLSWDRHANRWIYGTKNPAGRWINVTCRGEYWEGHDTVAKARALAEDFIHSVGEKSEAG